MLLQIALALALVPAHGASGTANRCAARAAGDPAKMSLCLAHHHLRLSAGDKRLRGCLNHARGGRAVVECMRVAAH